jgi:ADP-heptose:LPS heptosyltransferase
VLELWGLGDLTFSTPLLRAAVERYDVTLVGKAHARPLLEATFPQIRFLAYDAPWSAYRDKYRLWKWDWRELFALLRQLRRERFDAAVSVRNDPRDHFVMRFVGARARYGFPLKGSAAFLTHPLLRSQPRQHKVEDWRDIGRALDFPAMDTAAPQLDHAQYRTPRVDELLRDIGKPLVCLHPGARIGVRRWPVEYFASFVGRLRREFDFHLALIPDPDGYGLDLAPLVDSVLPALSVAELVDVLGRAALVLCNDSGPGHIASSCGRPAIVIFGPTDPDWFRPWGDLHHLVIRDICPWRPCFDYCKFSEPYCMTKLLPDKAWPEVREHLQGLLTRGVLPPELRRAEPVPA